MKNKKTPKQFLPGMKKRLAKLTAVIALMVLLPSLARAQFIGYQSPQSVQQTLATNVPCTGSQQTYVTMNLGQTQHTFTITPNAFITSMSAAVFGVDSLGNTVQISDSGYFANFATAPIVLQASGYYPKTELAVTCSPTAGMSSYSIAYSGVSSTQFPNIGAQLQTQVHKAIANGLSAGTTASFNLVTPFGTAASIITFNFITSSGPGGSTVSITCPGLASGNFVAGSPFTLATASGAQSFYIPNVPCDFETVTYTSGGASATNFTLEQRFFPSGMVNTSLGAYAHITGTTATEVKTVGGLLTTVNINTGAAGTISIFDLPTGGCTATPSTNTVAVLTAIASASPVAVPFNVATTQGICVKASAVMDLTVGYQ